MLTELIPNYLFKPGTRLAIQNKKVSKLLPESLATVINLRLNFNPGVLKFFNDGTLAIGGDNNIEATLRYLVLIERLGKTGKQRMEIAEMLLPLYPTPELLQDPPILPVDETITPTDMIEKLNENDFIYWLLAKMVANQQIELLYNEFINSNKTLIASKKADTSIRYKNTTLALHGLYSGEDARIETIFNHFSNKNNREEALIELREMEGMLNKAKLYYAIKAMAKIKISLFLNRTRQAELGIEEHKWGLFESFVDSILLANRNLFNRPANMFINHLPQDPIIKEALLYTRTHLT